MAAKSKFRAWYANPKNREALNKRRRERYKKDPKYRSRVLKSTRAWRKENPAPPAEGKPKTHFSIGEVAEQIDCEQKTIRTLEKQGLIPDQSNGRSHRRYTARQISLIRALVEHRKEVHYRDPKYKPRLKKLVQQAATHWGA